MNDTRIIYTFKVITQYKGKLCADIFDSEIEAQDFMAHCEDHGTKIIKTYQITRTETIEEILL